MDLPQELGKLGKQINDLRRLQSILSSSTFKELYNAAIDRTHIDRFISNRDLNAVEAWVKSVEPLDDKPVKELRDIARSYGIFNWHLLPKDELLCRILRKSRLTQPAS